LEEIEKTASKKPEKELKPEELEEEGEEVDEDLMEEDTDYNGNQYLEKEDDGEYGVDDDGDGEACY